jgi:hypothetical protein
MTLALVTAQEIALATGWSKRRVQSELEAIPADGRKVSNGQLANARSVADVLRSDRLRERLEKIRAVHHYGTLEDVLRDPVKPWQPSIPLCRLCESDISKAAKLQRALARALALPEEASTAERVRLASADFPAAMSYRVSERQLHALICRTMDRDRRAFAWNRLELYLDEKLRAKEASAEPVGQRFAELEDAFASLENRAEPTTADVAFCWRKILECYAENTSSSEVRKLRAQLFAYLLKAAPFLGETAEALKRNFNRKRAIAEKDGIGAVVDRRADCSGNRREAPEWDANINKLKKLAGGRSGRISQAYRELHCGSSPNGDQFTEAFRAYFPFNPRINKSQVPGCVRDAVRPAMAASEPIRHGEHEARIRLPSFHRAWAAAEGAGDYYTSDDVTVNHYWFEWAEFGDYEFDGRRFNVGRGQWLPIVDERTDCPLSFLLRPNKVYNGWAIRSAVVQTCSNEMVGLPFSGMKLERGIWMARNVESLFSWSKIDDAFARQNITLGTRHATTPKAKIIERVIGAAQNLMEHLPGYVGRDEMHVRFERVQKFLQSLKRVGQPIKAAVDPRDMLMEKEQFADELTKVMRTFADEPQNGERLAGLSPSEAWKQFSPGRPHMVLPPSLRYLLSSHRSEQTVTHEGVRIKVDALWNYYCGSEQLGALLGEKVAVYFNQDLPEQVVVVHPRSDPRGLNAFAVPLFQRLPANTATKEQFERARAHQKAFAKYGRDTFRLIAPTHNLTLRSNHVGTPELRAFGERHGALEREHIELNTSRDQHRREIGRLAARNHLKIDPDRVKQPARVAQSLRRAAEAEERALAAEAADELVTAPVAAGKAAIGDGERGQLFAVMNKFAPGCPKETRANITRRVLGYAKSWGELTRGEWGKLISALNAISKGNL